MFGYVYSLTVVPTGQVYIGQTTKWPEIRWREHLNALARGHHPNHKMQAAAKKYGITAFLCREVAQVPLDKLDAVEHEAILAIPEQQSLNLTRNRANFAASRKRREIKHRYEDTLWYVDDVGPLTPQQLLDQFGWSLPEARKRLYRNSGIRMIRRDTLGG